MKNPFRRSSPWRWPLIGVIAVGVLAGGYVTAKHVVRPRYKQWRIDNFNHDAQAFLAKDDALNALVLTRKSLQVLRENPDAWRIAAAAAKKLDRVDALFYQENLCTSSPTKENYLELLRLSLRFNQDTYAVGVVGRAAKFAATEPEFHELAAKSFLRVGRPLGAKYHLIELIRLRPADKTAQLDLNEILMGEDTQRKDASVRSAVSALAQEPELRARALYLLLRESVTAGLRAESNDLSARLQVVPGIGIKERKLLVEAAVLGQPDRAPALLAALQKDYAGKPEDASQVIDFMVARGWAKDVAPWAQTLAPDVRKSEPVRRALAEATFALGQWDRLRAILMEGDWPVQEYLRRALLAYSFKVENRLAEFDEAWKGAVIEAGTNVRLAVSLLGKVDSWRWDRERYDVMWRLFQLVPDNAQVRNQLLVWERRQNNTANLNRLFARVMDADSADNTARNNYAYTSLLLDANVSRAGLITADLVTAEPGNPYYLTTRAFALYKQGKYSDAVRMIESLRSSALAEPERIVLHSLFLCKVGEYAKASERMANLVRDRLLPEELALAKQVDQELARHIRTEDNASRLIAMRQAQAGDAAAGGWMAIVKPDVKSKASVDMELSDSLYASGDFKALELSLKEAQWQEFDYLRFALMGYARRRLSESASISDQWRQSLLLAQRSQPQLENLLHLATRWGWSAERIEVLNRLHAASPNDRMRLEELMAFYRQGRRTAELVRVLRIWVDANAGQAAESVAHSYYSLLIDQDVTQATVRAKALFDASPDDADRRLVYAYSLWRQQRSKEADELLKGMDTRVATLVPDALIRAAVAVEFGRNDEAQAQLGTLDTAKILPEEAEIARRLTAKLNAVKR